jgi:hypothetical protein
MKIVRYFDCSNFFIQKFELFCSYVIFLRVLVHVRSKTKQILL